MIAPAIDRYREFLQAKIRLETDCGLTCDPADVNPILQPFQRDIVCWAVRGGYRAIFAAFGLGKTMMQLEVLRLIREKTGAKHSVITLPLGVRQEFIADAHLLNTGDSPFVSDEKREELLAWLAGRPDRLHDLSFIRLAKDAEQPGAYLTNYESVRDGKIDPSQVGPTSLDEAAILRGLGGTKTFREFMGLFEHTEHYRFVATATPSPNEYIELLAYAAFLGIMDVGEAKTRFFKRDSTQADNLTLHPHKEREFWLWVSTWALFVQKPSDLGYSDEGYDLPPIEIHWHEVESDHSKASLEGNGQHRIFADTAIGVQDAAREKRDSLNARMAKMMELREIDPGAHRIIWHDLEAERKAIESAIPGVTTVYGSQSDDEKESAIVGFSHGRIQELAGKPVMLGSGCNFQRHCSWAIFLGIGFKFNDFIQAIFRIYRFLQTRPVRIDIIFTEAERKVREDLLRKWEADKHQRAVMSDIIKQYGLSAAAMASEMQRSFGTEREEESGPDWKIVKNDCVEETMQMEPDSVDLIVTSIPFSTQYEYTPSFNDFGHTDDNSHFWQQMDFLTPELLRVLEPGRLAVIHVKDRITPGGINKFGFQTVEPFSDECVAHFRKHGFAFIARKTIVTDVVRENNQTYRLGWTEQCKDGSRMGNGMPEYLLVFRKPPTDRSNGYADVPVVKSKAEYSLPKWQFDAHGFARSSGDRLLGPDDLEGLRHEQIFKAFKKHSLSQVYNFDHDVALATKLADMGSLPTTFMLLQPQSWHPDVWADVVRMRSLNTSQSQRRRESHLCPFPLDIVERCIEQYSMVGEVVYDPFCGLGSVPYVAVQKGRIGWGCELSPVYFAEAAGYCRAAHAKASVPTLFDLPPDSELEGAA